MPEILPTRQEPELNIAQKEAVLEHNGPLLIIAGAGAGKTKTVTERIVNIIKGGTAPHHILAVTFTNKAAKEMRERVFNRLRTDSDLNRPISFEAGGEGIPFINTFHGLGVHIIKENASRFGLTRHFTIFDRSDSKRAIKEGMETAGIDPKQFEQSKILSRISKIKGDGQTMEEYREHAGRDFFGGIVTRVWQNYEAILAREKALDFDDLLLKTALLLRRQPEILEHYQNIWRYIHIDEYQDTNAVQYSIARLLAAKYRNICVVGDIDQMIYSWRGANLENILNFEKEYPEAKVILLEQNYRSTKTILEAANRAIEKNTRRRPKNLFTENEAGERIGLYSAYDEGDEADFIAEKSASLIRSGVSAQEIAVLYRANFQSRVLEEAFLNRGVSYQVLGTRFFERKEVKDVLSYLRAALNPESFSDISRVINVPARGVGKVTVGKIFGGGRDTLPAAVQRKVTGFYDTLSRIAEKALMEKPSDILKFIIKDSGLEESFVKAKTEEDIERLENLKELVSLATRYDSLGSAGVEQLLSDAALASDQDTLVKKQEAVKLMTIHASKGLEFNYVFITGLEDGLFPHQRDGETETDSDGKKSRGGYDDEEERRLFYVALTRARKKVFLSYAGMRTVFGSKQVNIPSEFILDIDERLMEAETRTEPRRTGIRTIYLD
jgi:DNA helicase-2/ATP-dependent DNA helicase PcrA